MAIKLRERVLKNGDISFYLDIYMGDDRWTETIKGLTIKYSNTSKEKRLIKEALSRVIAKRELALINEDYGIRKKLDTEQDFLEFFKSEMEKKNPKTKENWNSVLVHLYNFSNKRIKFKHIDKKWFERFFAFLKEEGLSPNSIRTYYQKINAVLNQSVKDDIISSNPTKKIDTPPKEETEINFLTIEEMKKIYNTEFFNDEVKRAFLFACYTGLRVSDIMSLTWGNIETSENGNRVKKKQLKTSVYNYFELSENALKLIGQRKDDKENVFDLPKDHSSVNRCAKKLLKEAGITKKLSFHSSRHTAATQLLNNGVDIFTVQKLLGHKNIKSTQVYTKIIDKTKTDAVNKIPSIF